MKTRLLGSRRTVYILALSLLVALTLPAFSAFAWGGKPARYETTEVILAGLSGPSVQGKDFRGNIYFSEEVWPENGWLNKYDIRTGEVTEVISPIDGFWFADVDFDFWGNMYYLLYSGDFMISQLYKLGAGCEGPELILEMNWPEYISEIEVDWCGHMYIITAIVDEYFSIVSSQFWEVPVCSDEPEFLFELDGSANGIQISLFLRDGIYFMSLQDDGHRIFQYKSGELTEILYKSLGDFGILAYLELSPFRGLYYLYRQRSAPPPADLWGYIEIGQFTPRDLHRDTGPRILASEDLDDRAPWFWGPVPDFSEKHFVVYGPTGDVFFFYYPWIEGDVYLSGSIMWLDARTGILKEIFVPAVNDAYITLDHWGNLYVFDYWAGTMTCIYRK